MVSMNVMQMAIYQVIDVVPVRDRLMSTARPMHMVWRMTRTVV